MTALRGRTVVLTGATGGIGGALCDALVEAGARVLAVGRNAARLQALADAAPLGAVQPVEADLATAEGRARVIAASAARSPAVLVLAHAQPAFGLFEDASGAELRSLVETNLIAPMLLVHDLLPLLARQPDAAVVAVGSTFGSLAFPGFAAYSATKFGLRGLFEALAREHHDTGVRFQYLSPRATRTGFNSPEVDALNRELKVSQDEPAAVARALVDAIVRGRARLQIGWPERLFTRINGVLPALVDRNLRSQLPIIRRHARPTPQRSHP